MDYDNGFTDIINLLNYVQSTSVPYQKKINSTIYKIKSFQTALTTDKANFILNIEELNELEVVTKEQKEEEVKMFDDLKKQLNKLEAKSKEQQEKVAETLDKLAEAQKQAQTKATSQAITKAVGGGLSGISGSISSMLNNKTATYVKGIGEAMGALTSVIGSVVDAFNGADISEVVRKC